MVKVADYRRAVSSIPFGKRLPGAVYLHADILAGIDPLLKKLVEQLAAEHDPEAKHNLVKFHLVHPKVSLLSYPDFDEDAHPGLDSSIAVDLLTGRVKQTSYRKSANPPILHRKETFLAADDPRRAIFEALTEAEEEAGLLVANRTIGFRENWKRLLSEKGVEIRDHTLVQVSRNGGAAKSHSEIAREKTALTRYELSKPVKVLLEYGLLKKGQSFFDYGCGLGSDVRGLANLGYDATGWDPHFAPHADKVEADVVNLGFVLNVIEDPAERVDALVRAWALARRVLIVSTIVGKDESEAIGERFGDGVRTRLNTFQKYFQQAELQAVIEHALGVDVVAAGLCVFIAFRDERDAQDFLSSRYKRAIDWTALSLRLGLGRPAAKERKPRLSLYERHAELLDAFWNRLLELGRDPKNDEFDRLTEVRKVCGSLPRAKALFEERFGPETMEAAREQRREDLLVFLASSQFRKRVPFKDYSLKLQNDIRVFFGGYELAMKRARDLLFTAGDPGEIELSCEGVGFGFHTVDHFAFHSRYLDRLPALLRIYVGCGTALYGNPREADVIKIHKRSRKLSLMHYKDFWKDPFPELHLRIKIELNKLFVSVFDHSEGPDRQILFFKERFLDPDCDGYGKLIATSRRLATLDIEADMLGDNDRWAPSKKKFEELLAAKKLTWRLHPKRM